MAQVQAETGTRASLRIVFGNTVVFVPLSAATTFGDLARKVHKMSAQHQRHAVEISVMLHDGRTARRANGISQAGFDACPYVYQGENIMDPDTERLQILLKIARENRFSLDELNNWTWHLDWEEFRDWSAIFLKAQAKQDGGFRPRSQLEIVRPYRWRNQDGKRRRRSRG